LRHLDHEAILAHLPGITGEKGKGSGWLPEPFLRLLRLRKPFRAARKYFLTQLAKVVIWLDKAGQPCFDKKVSVQRTERA
jgi:hypothetical protein